MDVSGGALFDYSYPTFEALDGVWRDEEINALVHDLIAGGEFSARDYGGLLLSLDFAVSGDTAMDDYRDDVRRFKSKWFGRTPEERAEFYAQRLQERADELKAELAGGAIER